MATRKRRRRRSTASTRPAVRRRRRSPMSAAPKRRRRRLGDSGGSMTKRLTNGLKTTGGGALGGALYTAPQFAFAMPWWGKLLYGGAVAIAAGAAGAPSVGAGSAGAAVFDLAKNKFALALKDDMQDAEYVDSDTLSDTGFCDENGNEVVMDDDGVAYQLNDDGDYQAIGMADDLFALNDGYRGDDMNQLSMVPVADAYSLNDRNY